MQLNSEIKEFRLKFATFKTSKRYLQKNRYHSSADSQPFLKDPVIINSHGKSVATKQFGYDVQTRSFLDTKRCKCCCDY